MKKLIMIVSAVGFLSVAGISSAFVSPHSALEQYKSEKEANLQKVLNNAHSKAATAPRNYAPAPQAVSKPDFKFGKVEPMSNGTYQIGFLDHGPVKINDLWLIDLKGANNNTVWNEDYVYSGTSRDDPNKATISEFTINTNESKQWVVSNSANGSLKIIGIENHIVRYETGDSQQGALNLLTGQILK